MSDAPTPPASGPLTLLLALVAGCSDPEAAPPEGPPVALDHAAACDAAYHQRLVTLEGALHLFPRVLSCYPDDDARTGRSCQIKLLPSRDAPTGSVAAERGYITLFIDEGDRPGEARARGYGFGSSLWVFSADSTVVDPYDRVRVTGRLSVRDRLGEEGQACTLDVRDLMVAEAASAPASIRRVRPVDATPTRPGTDSPITGSRGGRHRATSGWGKPRSVYRVLPLDSSAMTVATGHSLDLDSADAIAEALDACADALGGATPGAGLLFAGVDHDHQALLDGVEARYPGLPLIGGTGHGELSSDGFAEDSVALMLLHSDRIEFRAGVGENVRADPEGAARQSVAAAQEGMGKPVRLGLTVPRGLGIDVEAITDTLHAALGPDVPLCGGTSGDQLRFEQAYQFCNGRVYSDAVPVLLMAGPLRVATGVASGWAPMGDEHRLTKTEGQAVLEIDGRPVRDVWMQYFGSLDLHGARSQFALYPEGVEEREFYLCAPSHFDDDGRMVMHNPVIEGARIRFGDAVREEVLGAAGTSAAAARARFEGTPDAALVFSCAGRHAWLGTRIGREHGLLREHVGAEVPAAGFYTFSEICPLPGSPTPYTHGSSFVTVLIGEEA